MSITTAFRGFLERIVFADSLENVLAIATADELDGWREGRGGDFAHFLRLADSLALTELGRVTGLMMSYGGYDGIDGELFPRGLFSQRAIVEPLPLTQTTEVVSHAWMRDSFADPAHSSTVADPDKPAAYSWCKAPRLSGQPIGVGAIARQTVAGQAPITDLVARDGTNVRSRVIARLIETAPIALAMEQRTRALRLSGPFCDKSRELPDRSYVGLVEAARGFGHWMAVRDGKIERY